MFRCRGDVMMQPKLICGSEWFVVAVTSCFPIGGVDPLQEIKDALKRLISTHNRNPMVWGCSHSTFVAWALSSATLRLSADNWGLCIGHRRAVGCSRGEKQKGSHRCFPFFSEVGLFSTND